DGVSLVGPWLTLQRADYFSPQQVSGVIFNRETSRDAIERIERVTLLSQQSLYCRQLPPDRNATRVCHPTEEAVRLACGRGPAPGPDYFVLLMPLPQQPAGTWTIEDPVEG